MSTHISHFSPPGRTDAGPRTVTQWLAVARRRMTRTIAAQSRWVRAIGSDRWWVIGIVLLLVVFLAVLLIQPNAVGRGGR